MELKELSGCDHIIPSINSTENDSKPANDKLFSRVINRSRGNIKGIEVNFNAHDFRSTFSTSMADMGIAPHITELALGHKLPKIMATYNKHEYLSERAEALQQWSDKIEIMVTNENVVMLKSNR